MGFIEEVPPAGGWTIEQALNEVTSDGALAALANAKKERAYAVEVDRWIEAGSPHYPVDPAYYLRLGMFPVWTLDEAGRTRRLTKYELPPNPFLAAAALANANLHLSRATGLVRGFRSGEVVAAGAKGHPTNPISWLPPHLWSNYMPNVPSNEARWSAALDLGRKRGEMVLLQELWDSRREHSPASVDTTYFRLRIFIATDLHAVTSAPVDVETDPPPRAASGVHANGEEARRKSGQAAGHEQRKQAILEAARSLREGDAAAWKALTNLRRYEVVLKKLGCDPSHPPNGYGFTTVLGTLREYELA
jgi:hypothetical protein